MHIITKFANGNQRNIKQLDRLIKYITSPRKTNPDLICTNGLCDAMLLESMLTLKHLTGQTDGRQYIHWITSFNPDSCISPQLANELGREFIKGFNDFQWIMATHTDRNHIHNHYVMNSVNYKNGKKFSQSPGDLEKLKNEIDKIYHSTTLYPDTEEEYSMKKYLSYDFYDYDDCDDYSYSDNSIIDIETPSNISDYENDFSEIKNSIQAMSRDISMLAQCMSGFAYMYNPQNLSNMIAGEINRQLDERFGTKNYYITDGTDIK